MLPSYSCWILKYLDSLIFQSQSSKLQQINKQTNQEKKNKQTHNLIIMITGLASTLLMRWRECKLLQI